MDAMNTIKSKMKELSIDELREANGMLVDELNHRVRLRDMNAIREFNVGMRVKFGNKRRGHFTGKVTKINQRTLSVKQDDSHVTWTVAPTACTIIPPED